MSPSARFVRRPDPDRPRPRRGTPWHPLVANDGDGFTQANFDALCSPTLTTKSVNEAIGNKGVGFLTSSKSRPTRKFIPAAPPLRPPSMASALPSRADETLRAFLERRGSAARPRRLLRACRLYLACPTPFFPAEVERLADEGFATVVRLPSRAMTPSPRSNASWRCSAPRRHRCNCSYRASRSSTYRPIRPSGDRIRTPLQGAGGARRHSYPQGRLRNTIIHRRGEDHSPFDSTRHHHRDIAAEALPEAWEEWTGDAVVSVAVAAIGDPLQPRLYNFLPMGKGRRRHSEAILMPRSSRPWTASACRGRRAKCVSAGGRAPTGLGRCGARASLPAARRGKAGGARSRVVEQE